MKALIAIIDTINDRILKIPQPSSDLLYYKYSLKPSTTKNNLWFELFVKNSFEQQIA